MVCAEPVMVECLVFEFSVLGGTLCNCKSWLYIFLESLNNYVSFAMLKQITTVWYISTKCFSIIED